MTWITWRRQAGNWSATMERWLGWDEGRGYRRDIGGGGRAGRGRARGHLQCDCLVCGVSRPVILGVQGHGGCVGGQLQRPGSGGGRGGSVPASLCGLDQIGFFNKNGRVWLLSLSVLKMTCLNVWVEVVLLCCYLFSMKWWPGSPPVSQGFLLTFLFTGFFLECPPLPSNML